MNGNAADTDAAATGSTAANGRAASATGATAAMDVDPPLTRGVAVEGATAAVKLSAAPPLATTEQVQAEVIPAAASVQAVPSAGGTCSPQRLAEEDFRALQQQARALEVCFSTLASSSFFLSCLRNLSYGVWLQVTFPELAALEESVAALDAWKLRARDQAGESAKVALPVLEQLMHDAQGLAVACAEVQGITQTVTAAQKWISQVRFPVLFVPFCSQKCVSGKLNISGYSGLRSRV